MEQVACLLCGSSSRQILFHVADSHVTGETFTLVRCNQCGLSFVSPRPGKEELGRYYGTGYYTTKESQTIGERLKTIVYKYSLGRNGILNQVLSPVRAQFHVVLPMPFGNGRVLEVGCGNGRLLDRFRSIGWKTSGTELLPQAARSAELKGHVIINSDLEDCQFAPRYFDAVILCHALEHLLDPLKCLAICSDILSDSGMLIIEVPNFASRDATKYKAAWLGLQIPTHLTHWTPHTLKMALERSGFHIATWQFFRSKLSDARANLRAYQDLYGGLMLGNKAALWLDELRSRVGASGGDSDYPGAFQGHFMTVYCSKRLDSGVGT